MPGLDPRRDLRVRDEFGEENLPVAEDEVAAPGHNAALREHDQRRALPVARQEMPRGVELARVRVLFGGCAGKTSLLMLEY